MNPLPETRWVWRRWVTITFTLITDALLLALILRTDSEGTLKWLGICLVAYNALLAIFYIGGATLTDIWKLISAVRTARTETVTETRGSD